MSAEETELTFIRCPSCRSLVPAVASRCRMCGHQFEKKSAAAEEENIEEISKKDNMDSSSTRPRVRQRTMSSDSKQVSEIKEQLKVNLDKNVSGSLTANLEENQAESEKEEIFNSEPSSDDFDIEEAAFENDDLIEDVEEKNAFDVKENIPQMEKSYNFDQVDSNSFSVEQESKWNKQKDKKDDLKKSFTETTTAVLSPEATDMLSPKAANNKVDMETKTETQFGDLTATTNGKKTPTENTFGKEIVENDGKLFGWLIAFGNDARGSASEVRAGKFFIGRQKLRSADMLVPDSSVSTPHCMVTASSEAGLLVQDLLSEKGTFYKKAGSQNYVQVSHLIELSHGDWLKFGDYEVMVCLVPYEKNKKK